MHPVHLIAGDDDLLVQRATERLLASLTADDPELAVEVHDASQIEQLPELRTQSLFGGRVCAVVRGVQAPKFTLSAGLKGELEDYVAAPDPQAVLVLTAVAGERGKSSTGKIQKIKKGVEANGQLIEANAPPDWKDKDWAALVTAEFTRLGRRPGPGAVAAIIEHAGVEPSVIAMRVGQVVEATANEVIAVEDVERIVEGHGRRSGFDLADAVADRDPATAITLLRGSLEADQEPLALLGAVAYRFRQLQQVRSGASPRDVRTSPGQHQRLQAIARSFHTGELAWCMDRIAQLDVDLKGNSELPSELCLELGIIDLSTSREVGQPWNPLA